MENKSKESIAKGMYKICVYAICKNESAFAERWMKSMSEADSIVVTDTGSTDDTVEKLRTLGAVVHEAQVKPWRFDVARNISLSNVPEDADICVCTDLDEILEPGWRRHLEKAWEKGTHRGNYWFNWSFKPDGSPDTQFVYFKVHTRHDFVWEAPVHEYLQFTRSCPEKKVFIDGMILNHYPDAKKSRASYLPLLELAVDEKPTNARNMYYLGREYFYAARWDECIKTMKKHLDLPEATWKEERCSAMRWIAQAYDNLNDSANCDAWFFRAIAECAYMREPYVEFAKSAYQRKDWHKVLYLTHEALKIKEKSRAFINKGYAWDHTPSDLAGIACYWLGLFSESARHFKKALEFAPDDKRLKDNLEFAEAKASV
ncbi:MAG: glycosyl transferase family 2 [Defluviitaleaceae bacterium]|nr:glycosyl transferase family 2 [Defluviitaleaceae bacterium]